MNHEEPFRLAVTIVVAMTLSVTGYHRFKAHSGEPISHKQEGLLLAAFLRLAGLCLAVAAIGYLISPASVAWASFPIPIPLRWIGVVTGLCCSLLMWWTLSSLGKNLTDTVVTRTDAYLVTSGPYRWVRHPFYLTAALLMASVTMLAANWLIAILSLVVLALLAIRTPREEQMLIERFGQQYRHYMASTGRFLPRFLSSK